jgi:plastocyanin
VTATQPRATPSSPPATHARWGRRVGIGLAAVLVVALVSTAPILSRILRDGAGQEPVVGVTEIVLADDWFTPSVVEVSAGSTITFTWDDGTTPHDIEFSDGALIDLRTHGSVERTVPPGDTTFRCTLHPGMTGRLVGTLP